MDEPEDAAAVAACALFGLFTEVLTQHRVTVEHTHGGWVWRCECPPFNGLGPMGQARPQSLLTEAAALAATHQADEIVTALRLRGPASVAAIIALPWRQTGGG